MSWHTERGQCPWFGLVWAPPREGRLARDAARETGPVRNNGQQAACQLHLSSSLFSSSQRVHLGVGGESGVRFGSSQVLRQFGRRFGALLQALEEGVAPDGDDGDIRQNQQRVCHRHPRRACSPHNAHSTGGMTGWRTHGRASEKREREREKRESGRAQGGKSATVKRGRGGHTKEDGLRVLRVGRVGLERHGDQQREHDLDVGGLTTAAHGQTDQPSSCGERCSQE